MGRRLFVLFVVVAIGAQVALAAPITVQPGTRLSGTLTNRGGATSSLSLRITVCGVTRLGIPFCRGRFRSCVGPGCVGRAGGLSFRPAWRNGPLLTLWRGGKRCHLHAVPDPEASVILGTYRCIAIDSGAVDVPEIASIERGTFVLTEETP